MVNHIKWPKIQQFQHLSKNVSLLEINQPITFRSKVKLHGTNVGIQITPDGKLYAQSRNRILGPGQSDNMGFAQWVEDHKECFRDITDYAHTVVLFGEWAGPGIQKGVAISNIPHRIFALFAVRFYQEGKLTKSVIDPSELDQLLLDVPVLDDFRILPFYGEPQIVDFASDRSKLEAATTMSKMVDEVEREDPWVKENFGVSGIGEGLVWYPQTQYELNNEYDLNLMFKTKGEKHSATKVKKLKVEYSVETLQKLEQVVDTFVTEPRMEQAVTEGCDGEYSMDRIGNFIFWVVNDIRLEAVQELEGSGLKWKDINRKIVGVIKPWYENKIQETVHRK